jgi:hypothetical protein
VREEVTRLRQRLGKEIEKLSDDSLR